ncbi:TldD/PmbA family protein [Candidatus Mcinerneyibacteriota bacterium]|nr:TldD/PmbA family protein [Candidatus Mcinerneyibacteriota bacterium]
MDKKERFQKIVEFIGKKTEADDYILRYENENEALTRFADNKVTQNIDALREKVSLTVWRDGKKATLASADCSEEGLKELVRKSEQAAESSVKDKEYLPTLEDDGQMVGLMVDPEVLKAGPEERAAIAARTIEKAGKHHVTAFGTVFHTLKATGLATANGLMKYYENTSAGYSNTIDKNGEKGNSFSNGYDLASMQPEKDFEKALKDAELLQKRKEFEPGRYNVLISAQAASKLMIWMGFFGADRQAVDEGYSPYSGKIGEKLIDPRISIGTDPACPSAPSMPFDSEGLAVPQRMMIEKGVLKDIPCSRFWAEKNGYEPWSASNVIISDGEKTEEELLASMGRGFYIKDLWYIRMVRMEDFTLTGMTRNGFFYVEDGKIVTGATHFRWNDSPLRMMRDVIDIGKGSGFVDSWYSVFTPSLLVKDFYLSSKTLF